MSHTKHTITNRNALTMAAVLSNAITPDAIEGMTDANKGKAIYRLGKTHGNIVRELKAHDDALTALQEKHIKRDKKGNKVPNVVRVKNEETGEWEDQDNGYEIADTEAFAADILAVKDETIEVELSLIPLEWLDGNTSIGGLASVCYMMIEEDE